MQPIESAIQAAMIKQGMQEKEPLPDDIARGNEMPKAAEASRPTEIEMTSVEPSSKSVNRAEEKIASASSEQLPASLKSDAAKEAVANGHSMGAKNSLANSEKVSEPEIEGREVRNRSFSKEQPTLQNGDVRNVASSNPKPANGTAAPLAGGAAVLARLR